MKTINKLTIAAAALLCAASASAQTSASGYFLEDYTYRFQLNPAFANSRNFVSMPGLGNLNVGLTGNLDLQDVIYNVNGTTTTFLNPGVNTQEFLSNISDNNTLKVNLHEQVLATGFRGFGGYNTISIAARADVGVSLPYSIFSLLKEGVQNQTYDISDINARGTAWAEIAFGHSHDINEEWRVGGTFKFLVGAGRVDADLREAQLTLGMDSWTVTTDADLRASVKGLTYETKVNDRTNHRYVNGVEIDGAGVGGYGAAFDLGAVYSPKALKDWTFSLAVLDLGFINWSNTMLASTNGRQSVNTDGYVFNPDDDAANSFSNEWDRLRDDVSAIYELNDMSDQGSRSTMLAATINTGVQYTFPLYRKLSFGLLNSTRINGPFTTTDFRLSANVAPVKCLNASVNVCGGTDAVGFGWLLNLHVPGFNFYLGMDRTAGTLSKQGVPLCSNTQVNLGLNFLF